MFPVHIILWKSLKIEVNAKEIAWILSRRKHKIPALVRTLLKTFNMNNTIFIAVINKFCGRIKSRTSFSSCHDTLPVLLYSRSEREISKNKKFHGQLKINLYLIINWSFQILWPLLLPHSFNPPIESAKQ